MLITGGGGGLGFALAKKFSKEYSVVILCRDGAKAKEVAKEVGCDFIVADLRKHKEIKKAVSEVIKKHKRIDCLVNNAGFWIEGELEENSVEEIIEAMDVNATGLIFITREVVPHMKKQKSGKIINVISDRGLYPRAKRTIYGASKWAVTGFTKNLQLDLEPLGISVTGFYPGSMKTNFFQNSSVPRDINNHMEVSEAVRAVEFIVNTPASITIPALEIKKLNRKV